jgi:hypothetical protein
MKNVLLLASFTVSFVACGGAVISETAGSAGSGGASTTGSSAISSGNGGADSGAPCQEQPDDGGPFMLPTCADLAVLTLSDPLVTDALGGSTIEPGETAHIHLNLNEVAGIGFSYYPGVTLDSADPRVTPNPDWLYAIFACQTTPLNPTAAFASDIPKGTIVTLTARVGMINQPCPNTYAIKIPITVH